MAPVDNDNDSGMESQEGSQAIDPEEDFAPEKKLELEMDYDEEVSSYKTTMSLTNERSRVLDRGYVLHNLTLTIRRRLDYYFSQTRLYRNDYGA